MTENNRTIEGATAGIPQLQTYLDTYPCTANTNGTLYFYFEVFDEPVSCFLFPPRQLLIFSRAFAVEGGVRRCRALLGAFRRRQGSSSSLFRPRRSY